MYIFLSDNEKKMGSGLLLQFIIYNKPVTGFPFESVTLTTDCVTGFPLTSVIKEGSL